MKSIYSTCCSLLVLLGLTGCSQMEAFRRETFKNGEGVEQFLSVDRHSTFPAVRRTKFEQINFAELIDPKNDAKRDFPVAWEEASKKSEGDLKEGLQYDLALASFRQRPDSVLNPKQRHRDAVQDRILGVSTSRCNVFKTYLRRQQADTNFLLGSATTIAGVIGALAPMANTRYWSGTAGIFSGVQAEFNSSYYSNLAAQVIAQGIETHQARLLKQLVTERQRRSVDDYSMEAAIKDAIYFDGTCSTVVGLQEAAESIKEVTNPGLPRAAEIIASVKAMNTIAQTDKIQTLGQSGELEQLLKLTAPKSSPLTVMALVNADSSNQSMNKRIHVASQAQIRLTEFIQSTEISLDPAYKTAQENWEKKRKSKEGAVVSVRESVAFPALMKGLIDDSQLKTCVMNMTAPAEQYAQAALRRSLTQEGSPERLNAQTDLLLKQAAADAAVWRVEWVLTKEIGHVQRQSDLLREKLLSSSTFDDSNAIEKLKSVEPFDPKTLGTPCT